MKKCFSVALLTLALFVTVSASAAAQRSNPALDIKNFCQALFHGDVALVRRMGIEDDEYSTSIVASIFTKGFLSGIDIEFSDDQKLRFENAVYDIFMRTNFETATVAENKNSATVKITFTTFENPFTEEALNAHFPANFEGMSYSQKVEAFIQVFIDSIKNARKIGTADMNIECIFDDEEKMWVPRDAESFGEALPSKIFSLSEN